MRMYPSNGEDKDYSLEQMAALSLSDDESYNRANYHEQISTDEPWWTSHKRRKNDGKQIPFKSKFSYFWKIQKNPFHKCTSWRRKRQNILRPSKLSVLTNIGTFLQDEQLLGETSLSPCRIQRCTTPSPTHISKQSSLAQSKARSQSLFNLSTFKVALQEEDDVCAPSSSVLDSKPIKFNYANLKWKRRMQFTLDSDRSCRKLRNDIPTIVNPDTSDLIEPVGCLNLKDSPVHDMSGSYISSAQSHSPTCSQQANNVPSDDVSINELASYLDVSVFIPKKMSPMAEMMYT